MLDSLGSIAKLIGESTELGKIAALAADSTANTAIGYAQGLVVAQRQVVSRGTGSSSCLPGFSTQAQIAAVLASASES